MSKGIYAHFLPAPSFDIDDLLLKRIERGSYYAVGWALIQKWSPIDLILWSLESQNVLLKKFIWFPLGYLRVIGPRSQLATIFGLWPTLLCNCKKKKKIVAVGVQESIFEPWNIWMNISKNIWMSKFLRLILNFRAKKFRILDSSARKFK